MSIATPKQQIKFFRIAPDGVIIYPIKKEEYERRKGVVGDNVRERKYEVAKEIKSAYEEVYTSLEGKIVGVHFHEHEEYGKSIIITIEKDGDRGALSLRTNDSFGTSLMELLPSVNFTKDVKINGYAKDNKRKVYISQGGESVVNIYSKWNDDKKVFESFLGYPTKNEDELKKFGAKEYWSKRFFPEVTVFLVGEIEQKVLPLFVRGTQPEKIEYPEEDINPNDIPF